uniref:Uncharacterized protein n=1 Tax=Rhizobium rhizogenes TaxID=359 RepID=A0A7S5DSV1_RHIRH|nr:hypothetical protein [Rhizobium rhizogenes]QCL10027.1 hypothetical protein pC5.8d_724 [Rhizobium rhizogenes]
MGEVLKFKPDGSGRRGLARTMKLEQELSLPLPLAAAPDHKDRQPVIAMHYGMPDVSEVRFPLVGIAIMLLAIAAYALVVFHLSDQPHYSARTNLLPLLGQQ